MRFWKAVWPLISPAKVRGPYVRVSWRPSEPAVLAVETDLAGAAGTIRRDGSYKSIEYTRHVDGSNSAPWWLKCKVNARTRV